MKINDLKIFVMHYKKLSDRKKRLMESLKNLGLDSEWIENFDANELTENDIKKYYKQDEKIWFEKVEWVCPSTFRKIKMSELSLSIKHIICFEKVLSVPYETALFLEDDVVFCDDFVNVFNEYFNQVPDDWDFIFLGNGCNLRIGGATPDKHFYLKDNPATKCTDSYIVRKSAVEKIMQDLVPITVPIDFELNYSLKKHNLKTYWLEPPIIFQGSQNGLYGSSIQG